MAVLTFSLEPKLISRKISVAGKLLDFHTVKRNFSILKTFYFLPSGPACHPASSSQIFGSFRLVWLELKLVSVIQSLSSACLGSRQQNFWLVPPLNRSNILTSCLKADFVKIRFYGSLNQNIITLIHGTDFNQRFLTNS